MPPSKPTHSWQKFADQRDRVILCLLKRGRSQRTTITRIFNNVFEAVLAGEGLANGVSSTTLDSQFQTMRSPGLPGHTIYRIIGETETSHLEKLYCKEIAEIHSTIQTLRLEGRFKIQDSYNSKKSTTKPTRTIPLESEDSSSEADVDTVVHVAHDLQQYMCQSTPPVSVVKKPSSQSQGSKRRQNHPILLFRCTESIKHFKSRRLCGMDEGKRHQMPPLYPFGSKEFWYDARPHLEWDHTYSSPFLSLAQNSKNAMRRVELEKSARFDKKMFLAVFSYDEVKKDAESRHGPDSGPYLVSGLFAKHKVSSLPDGYTGVGDVCS